MRFEVLTAVRISIVFFWVVVECGHEVGCQHLGGTLKMVAIGSSDTLVTTYMTKQGQNS
jgi:hypothetical protein